MPGSSSGSVTEMLLSQTSILFLNRLACSRSQDAGSYPRIQWLPVYHRGWLAHKKTDLHSGSHLQAVQSGQLTKSACRWTWTMPTVHKKVPATQRQANEPSHGASAQRGSFHSLSHSKSLAELEWKKIAIEPQTAISSSAVKKRRFLVVLL